MKAIDQGDRPTTVEGFNASFKERLRQRAGEGEDVGHVAEEFHVARAIMGLPGGSDVPVDRQLRWSAPADRD